VSDRRRLAVFVGVTVLCVALWAGVLELAAGGWLPSLPPSP
jgi:hypothetical protein